MEDWRQVELASSRGDLSLRTIEETLGSFRDTISIIRALMTRDFYPFRPGVRCFVVIHSSFLSHHCLI